MKLYSILCGLLVCLLVLGGCFNQSVVTDDVLLVGTESNFPPFAFKENNELTGFDIDLIGEVARRLGKKIEFKDMNFEALIPQAQLGSLHVIAAGMTPTPEREKVINFTRPYISGDPLFIVSLRDTPDTDSLASLQENKKMVVVNQGYTADLFMSRIEGPELVRLETPSEAFLALQNGRADAFVTAQNTLTPFFKKYDRSDYLIVPIDRTNEKTALIVSKKYPALLEKIQNLLDEMEIDGMMRALKQKWEINA